MPGLNYNWYKKMNRPRYELEPPSSGLAYLERIQPQQPRLSASSRHHFDQSITPRYILPRQVNLDNQRLRTGMANIFACGPFQYIFYILSKEGLRMTFLKTKGPQAL